MSGKKQDSQQSGSSARPCSGGYERAEQWGGCLWESQPQGTKLIPGPGVDVFGPIDSKVLSCFRFMS